MDRILDADLIFETGPGGSAAEAQAVEPIVGANAACYNVTVSPRAQMSHKLKDFALKCRMILRTNALGLH